MYWAVRADGTFEVIDGQQRTISICQYVDGEFAYQNRYFHNLKADEKEQILNYKLMVYVCSGSESEKLEWFETINIAGEKLTAQELRNAVYTGSWVSDAKRYFSKTGCVAFNIGSDYLNGSPIRQEYLETAIGWINNDDSNDGIKLFMAKHQHDQNATALWMYFQSVITWVDATFTNKRKKCVKKCVDRRKEVNTADLRYGLVTTKDYTDITVVCKVGPKVDGEFVCDAPTTIDIDTASTPFYSYYNIPVNY
jgi:hypothetical protein